MTIPAPRRVCIVTPGYISTTPRVVREADALSAAGYDVRVTFTQGPIESIRHFDQELIERKPWRTTVVGWSATRSKERWTHHRARVRHHVMRALSPATWRIAGVLERAEGRVYPELAAMSAAEAADLYIGHYPDGLAAAARAAVQHDARLAYDVEDLYADGFAVTPDTAKDRTRILHLERRYVPRCAYVSAVSRPVATVFAERYQTDEPVAVHNCHPWADRQTADGRILQRRGAALSLYWFSQVVGLNRGIQDAIRAAGLLGAPVQIHLQGWADPQVTRALTELATAVAPACALHFHASVPPHELLSRAAEHDVGLALEMDEILNRRLAVTNKQFLYFLAALAVAATDLPGQRSVMDRAPESGVLYPPGDVRSLAARLSTWLHHPARLAAAKASSLEAGRTTWNWERESRTLVDAVDRACGRVSATLPYAG